VQINNWECERACQKFSALNSNDGMACRHVAFINKLIVDLHKIYCSDGVTKDFKKYFIGIEEKVQVNLIITQ
jgi:hypothetical protein